MSAQQGAEAASITSRDVLNPGATKPSAREVGWSAFDTPEARAVSARKARIAVIALALLVAGLQIPLSVLYPEDVHAWVGPLSPLATSGTLFLILAAVYLVFAGFLGLRLPFGNLFGYILCAVAVFVWVVVLGGGPALYASPERSSPVALLSIAVSVGILIGLLYLRDANRAPDARAAG